MSLDDWTTKWKIKFNVDKCKAMYMGKNPVLSLHKMMGSEVVITAVEKNPGVMTDSGKHQLSNSQKADQMLGIMKAIKKTRKKPSSCCCANLHFFHS